MVVVDRYFLREVVLALLAVTTVLMLIIVGNVFTQLLSKITQGQLPVDILMPMLGLTAIGFFVQLLPVALFLAIILTLGRWYRDNEMAALMACGIGYRQLYRAAAQLLVPFLLFQAALVFFIAPWAADTSKRLAHEASERSELTGIIAGRFEETQIPGQVLYVEDVLEKGGLKGMLLHRRLPGGEKEFLYAQQAEQFMDVETGSVWLRLFDGYRYRGVPGRKDFQHVSFKEYLVQAPISQEGTYKRSRSSLSTQELWGASERRLQSELQWRLGIVFSPIVLVLLAIPLSHSAPRSGRFGKIIWGILVYVLYANVLLAIKSAMDKGDWPILLGLWPAHSALFALALFLVWQRYGNYYFLNSFRGKPS